MFDSTDHLVSFVKAMEKSAPKHYRITIDFCDLSDLVNEYINVCNQMENSDVQPVVHAHWVKWEEPKVTNPVYKCSNCDFDITVDKTPNIDETGFWIEDFRYCLCCGAKMDEDGGAD